MPTGENLRTQAQTPAINAAQVAQDFINRVPNEPGELPTVMIRGGGVSIRRSAENLFRHVAPHRHVFYRGGMVVELVNDGPEYDVKVLTAAGAQSQLEKYVQFVKRGKGATGVLEPTIISKAMAEEYLNSEAARTMLPKFNGLLACPLMIEKKGQLHTLQRGYDEATGYFVTSAQAAEDVPLNDAVELLSGWMAEYDFFSAGDRSRAIASMITPALKLGGFIRGPVPIDVAEADKSQSGKTLRQKVIAAIYNQKPALVAKKKGGVGSMEETFGDHLVKGRVFIQFDNVRGDLNSEFLEAFVTAEGKVSVRTPYMANVEVDSTKFLLFISSNGFVTTEDLANRSSIIRIRKRENYQFRQSNGMGLLEMTSSVQPALLGSVFSVIREWHRRGKPKTNETRHSFREWCQPLDWIMQNIFHAAPLMDGHNAAKIRAQNPRLTFLRTVALKLKDQNKIGQQVSASDITDICLEENIEMPGLSADKLTQEEGKKQFGRIMKNLFGDKNELDLDEFTVERAGVVARTMVGNNQALYRYTFRQKNPALTTPAPRGA